MSRVLIIEDDREISDLISIHLKDMDLEVSQSYDGKDGLLKAINEKIDLIILDIRLPYLDGLELCKKLRMEKIQSLVLILTSKSEEIDKVLGLEIGADDYLTKPFSIRELVARVKALLRRREMFLTSQETEVEDKELHIGDLMINEGMRKVRIRGESIELSPKEFDLLVLMLFAAITLLISVNASSEYSMEVNQELNRELAASTVKVVIPLFKNGEIDEVAIQDIIHSMMVINPSVEVYILDADGRILTFVAPDSVVQMERVGLDPIIQFIDNPEKGIILGDDPRNPGESKIFSAARIFEEEKLAGYIYIVLASQEYISAADMVLGSYILGVSIRTIIAVMIVTAIVGLIAIWLITKRLNVVIRGIRQFQSGDLTARIPARHETEFGGIGLVFNNMAEEIQKNIKALEDLDTLRKELISNISHDLRTPVASIQGYAETLIMKKNKISEDESKKYLDIIVRSCERLKNQIADLFELSKLQAGQVDLQPEPFSIGELVQDVVNKYRILSQKKGININVLFSKDIPLVRADLSLIDRALQNLLDNAIKFCREDDIINIEINTKKPGEVELRISDSGVGISQGDLPYIFERYFKNLDHEESTGLGLAIVKRIIDLHDSTIEVFSQPGKGTTFAFSLPMAVTA